MTCTAHPRVHLLSYIHDHSSQMSRRVKPGSTKPRTTNLGAIASAPAKTTAPTRAVLTEQPGKGSWDAEDVGFLTFLLLMFLAMLAVVRAFILM